MFKRKTYDFVRENKTVDIVKRKKVIVAEDIILEKHPVRKPVTVFNPSVVLTDNEIRIFARVVLGYFTYASAIAEIRTNFDDFYRTEKYIGKLIVLPDSKYDIWGAEDPRAYYIGDNVYITYCGRTVNYFDPSIRTERTLPITAVEVGDEQWDKIMVTRLSEDFRSFVISDKDAFLVKNGDEYKLFHRLHLKNEQFYLVVSKLNQELPEELSEVPVTNTEVVLEAEKFEDKLGWGTPPIKVDKNKYVLLLHGVESETKAYKVLAAELNNNLELIAVTPYYIMEPKEIYERYGDRPYVVFPCGACLLDDKLLISYGAADSAIGIGEIDISELMSILDKGRIW